MPLFPSGDSMQQVSEDIAERVKEVNKLFAAWDFMNKGKRFSLEGATPEELERLKKEALVHIERYMFGLAQEVHAALEGRSPWLPRKRSSADVIMDTSRQIWRAARLYKMCCDKQKQE